MVWQVYVQVLFAPLKVLVFIRQCILNLIPQSPSESSHWFAQAKKDLSLIHIPDTSHLPSIPTTLQTPFPGNCVLRGRETKQTKNHFDHFIRVQPTVFPYAEIRTGNTDVTSVSPLPTLPFERTGTLHRN